MVTISQPGAEQPFAVIHADSGDSLHSVDEQTVTGLYKKHGAILFRGFSLDLEAFQRLTATFCIGAALNDSPGRTVLDEGGNIQTVDPGSGPFPLHPEGKYFSYIHDASLVHAKVLFKWRAGDVAMFDNTRFMHGRNAIVDLRERKIMSYFDYLKFAEPGAEEPVNAPWRQPGFRPPPTPYEPV